MVAPAGRVTARCVHIPSRPRLQGAHIGRFKRFDDPVILSEEQVDTDDRAVMPDDELPF
jgi:hypothetical protein